MAAFELKREKYTQTGRYGELDRRATPWVTSGSVCILGVGQFIQQVLLAPTRCPSWWWEFTNKCLVNVCGKETGKGTEGRRGRRKRGWNREQRRGEDAGGQRPHRAHSCV